MKLSERFVRSPYSWQEGILVGVILGVLLALCRKQLQPSLIIVVFIAFLVWIIWNYKDVTYQFKKGRLILFDGFVFGLSLLSIAALIVGVTWLISP